MSVRVDVSPSGDSSGTDVTLDAPGAARSAPLGHEVLLSHGVRLATDLDQPSSWRRLSVRGWAAPVLPLVSALVGERLTKEIDSIVADRPTRSQRLRSEAFEPGPTSAAPWLRVAVVHGLDRWLHLPLEQSLVHAEIGIARLRAALSLPSDADVRDPMLDEALGWARRAATGVRKFLDDLAGQPRPLPPVLRRSLQGLADGYAQLLALVAEPDAELSGVGESWRSARRSGQLDGEFVGPAKAWPPDHPMVASDHAASMIDPRHVRARVLQLGARPDSPEIALSPTRANGEDAVRIEVPSFDRQVDPEIARRLMARLVDRRSGDPHSYAALAVRSNPPTATRPSLFECTVPLRGSALVDLRAEVFDAVFRSQLAARSTESDVLTARRAVLSLRRTRSSAARAELAGGRPDQGPGRPLVSELVAAYQSIPT